MKTGYLAGVIAMVLGLAACGGKDEAPAAGAAPSQVGERFTVASSIVADLKPVAGEVTTRQMGEARARIGGTLVRVNVKEGDQVRQGQVIALVADQRLSHETAAFAAQAAAAEAEAARAKADLSRFRTLYEKGFYAKASLDQIDSQSRAAEAALRAARAQQAGAVETASQGAILAPASGRVLEARVPAGSVVSQGQVVAVVTAGEPLVRIEIPEGQARALRPGQSIDLDPADLPGVANGVLAQVYPSVTAGRAVADIAVPGLRADLVGQRVRARIKVGERQAIILPRRFVATRFGIDYVRLVDKSGRAEEIAVQLAPGPDSAGVEVLSGLNAGDVIAAMGASAR